MRKDEEESVMKKLLVRAFVLAAVFAGIVPVALAQTAATGQEQNQVRGRDLTTEQERLQYQERMRSAGSEEERRQIRQEHHNRMQKRAAERGVTMPSEPPTQRMGSGRGAGRGMQGGGKGMSGGGGRSR